MILLRAGMDLTSFWEPCASDFPKCSTSNCQGLFDCILSQFEGNIASQSYVPLLWFGSFFQSFATKGPFGAPLACVSSFSSSMWLVFDTRWAPCWILWAERLLICLYFASTIESALRLK